MRKVAGNHMISYGRIATYIKIAIQRLLILLSVPPTPKHRQPQSPDSVLYFQV